MKPDSHFIKIIDDVDKYFFRLLGVQVSAIVTLGTEPLERCDSTDHKGRIERPTRSYAIDDSKKSVGFETMVQGRLCGNAVRFFTTTSPDKQPFLAGFQNRFLASIRQTQ